MNLRLLVVLGFILFIFSFQTALGSVLFEDRFENLENWVVVKSEANAGEAAVVQVVPVSDVPSDFGPNVLELQGKILEIFAKNLVVSDCLIEILWRDVEPVKADADGPLMARAQLPPGTELDLPLPTGNALYWLEHDSDAGFQIKVQGNFNQERLLAMVNHAHKTTGAWNQTGWIWQKWLLQGNQLKATYWPQGAGDPGWLLEVSDETLRFGGVGFRIWSGHAQIAFIRISALPQPHRISSVDLNLKSLHTVFDQHQSVDFSLFVVPPQPGALNISLNGPAGQVRQWEQQVSEADRIQALPFSWNTAEAPDGHYKLIADFRDDDGRLARDSLKFDILSQRETRERLRLLKQQIPRLEKKIQQAKKEGLPTGYQRVTCTGARHSLGLIENDLQAQKRRRPRETVEYYLKSIENALDEIQQMRANPVQFEFLKFTPPTRLRPKIQNGAFYQNDKPVIYTGLCGWDDVAADIPLYDGYGYNLAGIEIGPSSTVLGPGKEALSVKRIDEFILPALKSARKHNVAVMLLVSPHYFPKWAFTAYPAVKTCGHGFLKYCIENPDARKVIERHLRFLVQKIKNEPALHSYCLANEPQFIEKCELSRQKFQQFLKENYATINQLNATWQRDYPDFSAIEIPPENEAHPAVKYDWLMFHSQQVTAFFRWMKSVIRAVDPQRPVHIKFMMDVFEPDEGQFGIDREALGVLCEISGCDAITSYPDLAGEFAADFQRQNMFYDLLRSFQPGKPIFNSEAHIIRDNDLAVAYPGNYLRASLWEAVLHGQCANAIWVWARQENHPDLVGNLLHRPAANESAGRTALDLQRLAPELIALANVKSPVGLLFSRTSKLLSGAHYLDELKQAYTGLAFLGLPVRFISERQIEQDWLQRFKLLIVPGADYIREAAFEKIQEFTRDGGALVATANAFQFNQHGQPRERHGFVGAFKMHSVDVPLAVCNLNLQEIQHLKLPQRLSSHDYTRLFQQVISTLGIQPAVRVTNLNGENVRGVEVLSTRTAQGTLVSVVNWLPEAVRLRLVTQKPVKMVRNLIDHQVLDADSFLAFSMEPLLLRVED